MTHGSKTPPDALREARASGPAQAPEAMHRLSMVHKTRKNPIRMFQVWKKGSLAIFPGIPNYDPKANKSDLSKGGIRGKVTSLSDASRRNLMIYLAKIQQDAPLYTMALTLPGDVSNLTSTMVHQAFKTLCNRFTASNRFKGVGIVWKRELQRRGVLHYHLIATGLDGIESPFPQTLQYWLAKEWNELVCKGLDCAEKTKHWLWHCHDRNLQKVHGNIQGYFAKYIGKPQETVKEEIPGRWWGKVNCKAIPISEMTEIQLPIRAAIIAHRLARKLTQKRANASKHYRMCATLGMLDFNKAPKLSEFAMIAAMHRRLPPGEHGRHGDMIYYAAEKGLRWGKAKSPRFVRFRKIRLISKESPETANMIMRFVATALRDWLDRNPF